MNLNDTVITDAIWRRFPAPAGVYIHEPSPAPHAVNFEDVPQRQLSMASYEPRLSAMDSYERTRMAAGDRLW
jgi:hypothetical protein